MRRRSSIRRSQGSSWMNRIDVSNVAPPHISTLNRFDSRWAIVSGDGQHVVGAHARREQRLVRVAHRRVGDQQSLLVADPLREPLGSDLEQLLPQPVRWAAETVRAAAARAWAGLVPDRSAVFTSARPLTITSARYARIFVARSRGARLWNSSGVSSMNVVVAVAGGERRMGEQVEEERDVGLHAADAELAQRAVGAAHRLGERRAPGRELHEQRVEVRRDDCAARSRCRRRAGWRSRRAIGRS